MMVKILILSTPCLQMSQALTTWFIEALSKDIPVFPVWGQNI